MIDLALMLIVLHTVDGQEVRINPTQVNSLRVPRQDSDNKLFTEKANCMINTTDGKYVTVVETCDTIFRMIQELR